MALINKKNLSEQIYESLKADILSQKIGFGEKLINRNLQLSFGVSSTPVRDAINRLYLDGLLEDISNGGARVICFDRKIALEVNEIVALLNRDAISLTVARGNQEKVVNGLSAILEKQKKTVGSPKYLDYDKQFHHLLFQHSENHRLIKVYDEHTPLWDMLIAVYFKDNLAHREQKLIQHQEILEVYRAGEYERAETLVMNHFLEAANFIDLQD